MKTIELKILKGFRDFLHEQMAIRQKVFEIVKNVFESYGFVPIETPCLEYAETLLGKSGKEAEKLDKVSFEEVKQELITKDIKLEIIEKIFQLIKKTKPNLFLQ